MVTLIIHRLLTDREKKAMLKKLNMVIGALFHLTEELEYRTDMDKLPHSDMEHISGDIKRVYVLLLSRWIDYVMHLKDHYPYLYSLAVRTNPLDDNASPIVGD